MTSDTPSIHSGESPVDNLGKHVTEPGFSRVVRKRLLVTGSRTWPNGPAVTAALQIAWLELGAQPTTLVHGGARGVDTLAAEAWATQAGQAFDTFFIERYPARWDIHGKAAGHIRNAEMVALGADLCVAFIHNRSRGATGCLELAERAGIRCVVYRLDDGSSR